MVEQADTRDLKSLGSDTVPVQVRSAAPQQSPIRFYREFSVILIRSIRTISSAGRAFA